MTVNEHIFVRETPLLDLNDLCPDCWEPWHECRCELAEYQGAFTEKEPTQ